MSFPEREELPPHEYLAKLEDAKNKGTRQPHILLCWTQNTNLGLYQDSREHWEDMVKLELEKFPRGFDERLKFYSVCDPGRSAVNCLYVPQSNEERVRGDPYLMFVDKGHVVHATARWYEVESVVESAHNWWPPLLVRR